MQDLETKSYWSHVTGECLIGKMKGKKLNTIPVVQTSWKEWFRAHPATKVLKKSREVRSSQYESYFKDPKRTGLFRTHWLMDQMPGKDLVYGMRIAPHALAVSRKKMNSERLIQSSLNNQKIIFYRGNDRGVHCYSAVLKDEALVFKESPTNGIFIDKQTKSKWNLEEGLCIEGAHKGEKLKELQVTEAFWFAWSSFYPNTKVIK